MSFVVICFLLFWIFEVVLAYHCRMAINDAAWEGARYAAVRGSNNLLCSGPGVCADGSASTDPTGAKYVVPVVLSYASLGLRKLDPADVTVTWPQGTNQAGAQVVVAIRYPYVSWLALPMAPVIQRTVHTRILN